jgi:hypothetical protein
VACGAPDVGSGQPCGGKFGAACHAAILLARGPARLRDRLRRDIYAAFTLRSLLPLAGAPRSRRFYFVSTMRHSPAAPSRFGNSPNSVLPSRPAVMAVWQSNFAISLEGATSAGVANNLKDLD